MAATTYSVTWIKDAWQVRQTKVRANQRRAFIDFLKMCPDTKYKWVTEAKRQYLEGLRSQHVL